MTTYRCFPKELDGTFTAYAYVLCRSDRGDGGWSLHAPGATDEDIATGEAQCLASGPGEWNSETGNWSRPNTADYQAAQENYGAH